MTTSAKRLLDANPDAPERRSVPVSEFEFRTLPNNTLRFEGYASVFDKGYDVHGGANAGGWTEYVTRSAFDATLKAKPDVHLLINHGGLPLARTKSGTLRLGVDSTGLLTDADLDLRDGTVRDLAVKMERGDVDEMSFAFRVKGQKWSSDDTERSLTEVSLHKGDVSIVSFGANPHTSAAIRSAVERLTNLSAGDLAELRSMSDEVDQAVAALMASRKKPEDGSKLLRDLLTGLDKRALADPATSPLAQAIHDMCVEAGADCGTETQPDMDSSDEPIRSTAAPERRRQPGSGMSLMDARRLCRPADSPDPLAVADAKKLAS